MEKKSQDFSMKEAMRLANSPAGKQLAALLQQADQQVLDNAIRQAQQGNYENAAQQLRDLMASPQAQALLKELEK
ncbi:MAG: hypothetical protein E7435_01110 [Ruminococcaceae bacterium]|nr:hypothetical protein [Oscillospiraceae bacterium]